ncbi:MAG: hypothetical protein WA584_21205 [Pyrinomonadaceae bacterium]
MKVTIIIKGVGLSYQKDGVWKIIFPIDECHRLTLAYQKNQEEIVNVGSLATPKSIINLSSVNSKAGIAAASNIHSFIDLTTNYSHQEGIDFREDWRDHGVEMILHNAVISVYSFSDKKFVLSEIVTAKTSKRGVGKTKLTITKEPDVVGEMLKAEIEINEEDRFDIEFGGKIIESFNYEPDVTYRVIFDNDCHEEDKLKPEMLNLKALNLKPLNRTILSHGKNDFYMYYKLIKDSQKENRVFALTGLPVGVDESKFKLGADLVALTSASATVISFPCYKVIASKINSTFP